MVKSDMSRLTVITFVSISFEQPCITLFCYLLCLKKLLGKSKNDV